MSTPITRALERTYLPPSLEYVGYTPPTYRDPVADVLAAQREVSNAILAADPQCPHTSKLIAAQHEPEFWDVWQSIQELHEHNYCINCLPN